jgi:hypothetical protein
MPWAQEDTEPPVYAAEMLPASDFEKEAGPWRVEAWEGKGTGRLDTAERHSGTRSLRVDVPVESGDATITGLVWPQWGGGGLVSTLRKSMCSVSQNLPQTSARAVAPAGPGANVHAWRK